MFVNDPQFGNIVDFEKLRESIRHLYDALLPDFDMHKSASSRRRALRRRTRPDDRGGASMLAWMTVIAAGEGQDRRRPEGQLFTLGWTEEEIGSDLLSATTVATAAQR